tara:strand:+ start:2693 stop:2989 length:297 start_codon:yes stop_codon:yes gene_type:complete
MAEYQGKKVQLDKPSRIQKGEAGYGRKKFKVYVKDGDKVKKVMFGDPVRKIKSNIKKNKKNFRSRFNCDSNPPKDKTKARYWACKFWSSKSVTELLRG